MLNKSWLLFFIITLPLACLAQNESLKPIEWEVTIPKDSTMLADGWEKTYRQNLRVKKQLIIFYILFSFNKA